MIQVKNAATTFMFAVLLGAGSLLLSAGSAYAAETKGPQISRSIAKEVIAAQKALQANNYAEGLKQLQAAEAITPLTPFDRKTIDELKAFAYIKTSDLKSAQHAYEDALATGAATSEETTKYTRAVFSISISTQQYPKAIEYGKKLVDADTANADVYLAVTQSYYLQKDCKNATIWADKSISFARVNHETPKENLFLFKLQCAFDNNDTVGTKNVLEELVRLNGKSDHWNKLLRLERQDEREDRNLLMIYRIMFNTGSMNAGSDYMEMAQLLGDAALPGEAQAVVEKGIASGTIGADQKDRSTRLLNSVKQRADTDRKGLVQFENEAAKGAAGELDVKLGEVYFGFGDYQNAVTAINRGLTKGQIKHLDEAYVYLGLSQANLKNFADAKKAFGQLKSVPNISPRILKLWQLFSDRLGQ
ncbi:MAG: hypothetical protein ACHQIL_03730 [Steroidobacterales bacterium]